MTDETATSCPPTDRRTRKSDRALRGLVVFLIALDMAGIYIGWTAISRQQKATCYQLVQIESAQTREQALADHSFGAERALHEKSAAGLRLYAAGLRSIVPGCPAPSKPKTR